MGKILKIAIREYREAVSRKTFVVGVVLAPILTFGLLYGLEIIRDQVDTIDKKVAVIDHSGVIGQKLVDAATKRNNSEIFDTQSGKKIKPAYFIEIVKPTKESNLQKLNLSKKVKAKELLAFIELPHNVIDLKDDSENAKLTYHSENPVFDNLRKWITKMINEHVKNFRIQSAGLDTKVVKQLFREVDVKPMGLFSLEKETGKIQNARSSNKGESFGVPFIMVFLMWMMIVLGAMPLINSTLEEKTNRIYEILLGSARPFELMMGKLLGNFAISFTAAIIYIVGGIFAAHILNISKYIPYHILPWFFIYMIGAIFMSGSMFSAVGAACNDTKEVQSLIIPVILPIALPMFVIIPVVQQPMSTVATWLSLIPPCTPILMLLRQASPAIVPWWQPWVGLAGMVVYTLLIVWISGRIFRVGLLMQGSTPKIKDLVRFAIKG